MSMGFEEFRSHTVDAIGAEAARGIAGDDPIECLRRIDRMVIESELAYEDGNRRDDDDVREAIRAHFNDPTLELSWLEHPADGFPR